MKLHHRIMLAAAAISCACVGRPATGQPATKDPSFWSGAWLGQMQTPGGALEFGLDLDHEPSQGVWTATLQNASERIPVPDVEFAAEALTIRIRHYDSVIRLTWSDQEQAFRGEWSKRRSAEERVTLPLKLSRPDQQPGTDPGAFLGRWRVEFAAAQEPAVAVFEADAGTRRVHGTFLTPTGDYRYLSGLVHDRELVLSCFDGAHAFLFRARAEENGKLTGDFWSGHTWHDTWVAERDPQATLPDAFGLTLSRTGFDLNQLSFPDLKGRPQKLGDPQLLGRVTIIELFGSWCPNCHDAAKWLGELHREYSREELKIVGLAFELTGDLQRDAEQVGLYVQRHSVSYPVLLAGIAEKQKAARLFPLIDRIRAYPTFLFLDRTSAVRAVYTGFSGPATGQAYQDLQRQFRETIRKLLSEDHAPDSRD